MNVQIAEDWKQILQTEFQQNYFKNLVSFLKKEKQAGKTIYPKGSDIFKAFELTPFNNLKVVLLGQDPYHGFQQAHGLSFSVQKGVPIPPSLKNIYKELADDLQISIPSHGDLSIWARQGVLLLNASLTVLESQPMSHSQIGWELFTNAVIKKISDEKKGIVFLLWGRFAQQKITLINTSHHHILTSAHPSPLSAHNGFWGSKPFSKINQYLLQQNKEPINWLIPD
ncbi:MAG: uracil-DNA glycosylase [Chitinophagaceae bacterium]